MRMLDRIRQSFPRGIEFLNECWAELKKVHWPTREETRAATIAVVTGVIVVSIYLGIVDYVLSALITRVIER
jgi:preprotein translocase subunit SecE